MCLHYPPPPPSLFHPLLSPLSDVAALEDRFNRLKLRTETLSSGGHEREKMAAALLAEAQAAGAAWAGRSKQAYAAFLALAPAAAAMQPLLGQLQTLNEQEAAVRAELAAFDVRAAELQADVSSRRRTPPLFLARHTHVTPVLYN